jgi:hypothetical protein
MITCVLAWVSVSEWILIFSMVVDLLICAMALQGIKEYSRYRWGGGRK